jgi:hypothetical protein
VRQWVFIPSKIPSASRGGLNLYGYANGDPVSFSDPFGLCPIPKLCDGAFWASIFAGFVVREAARPALNNPSLANIPQDPDQSVWHQQDGQTGNVKFLSGDGHHESVLGPDGQEVTGKNAATYNYGTGLIDHAALDVIPYLLVGTHSPGDNTLMIDRISVIMNCEQDAGADLGGRTVCR